MDSREEVKALLDEFSDKITPLAAHLHLAISPQVCADERRHDALVAAALEDANGIVDWIRARMRHAAAIETASRAEDLRLRQLSDMHGKLTVGD